MAPHLCQQLFDRISALDRPLPPSPIDPGTLSTASSLPIPNNFAPVSTMAIPGVDGCIDMRPRLAGRVDADSAVEAALLLAQQCDTPLVHAVVHRLCIMLIGSIGEARHTI